MASIAITVILAIAILVATHTINIPFLTFAPIPSLNCGITSSSQSLNISNLCKALQIGTGGVMTSLSQVQLALNNGLFPNNNAAWLINLVVTGSGQQIQGTSENIRQAINSQGQNYSLKTSQNIAISYGLTNESYYIPYTNTGQNIELWNTNLNFINYNVPYKGFGFSNCVGSVRSNSYAFYILTCNWGAGSDLTNAFINNVTAYANACSNQVSHGILLVNTSSQANSWPIFSGVGAVDTIGMECMSPTGSPYVTAVYQPIGTKYIFSNVSITFSNGTSTVTGYISNFKTTTYITPSIYAQIYGYNPSGSDILGSNLPFVLLVSRTTKAGYQPLNQQNFISAFAIGYPASNNWIPSITGSLASFSKPGSIIVTIPNVYSLGQVINNTNQVNSQIVSFIQPLTQSQFYYGQGLSNFANSQGLLIPLFNSSGYNPKLGAVPYQPTIQLISTLTSLGLYVPAPGKPLITNIQPNPFTIRSGTTGTAYITVQNTGNLTTPFYVTANCGGVNFGSGIGSAHSIDPQAVYTFQVQINSPVSTVNTTQSCTATAYSSINSAYSNSQTFSENIVRQCPPSPVPIDPNTCLPLTTLTTTSTISPGQCPIGQICSIPIWAVIVIIIIIAFALIIAFIIMHEQR